MPIRNFDRPIWFLVAMFSPKRLSSTRLIFALGAAALISAVAVPSTLASTTQEALIQDNSVLEANPVGAMATFEALGVTRVKITIYWNQFAPSPNSTKPPKGFNAANPASYPAKNWRWLDAAVAQAKLDGLKVGFQIDAPAPIWAAGAGYRAHPKLYQGSWNPSGTDLEGFVKALGTRYSGTYRPTKVSAPLPRVSWWTIWNEPNFGFSLQPQSTDGGKISSSAIEYRSLVRGAWAGLSATGHRPSTDTILIGETAPRGNGRTNSLNWSAYNPGVGAMTLPLIFMQQLYCVGQNGKPLTGNTAKEYSCPGSAAQFRAQNPGLFQSSGWAIHPYGQGTPPSESTYDCPVLNFCQSPNNKQHNPYFADFAAIPNVERVMDKLQSDYGSHNKMQLWDTEFGYWSVPPTKLNPKTQKGESINQTTAAYYMNWAEYLSYVNPRLMSFSQYQLQDPSNGQWGTGLETSRGAQKPGYDAFMVPFYMPTTKASHATTLTVWGAVRPAALTLASSGLHQQAEIQFLPAAGVSAAASGSGGGQSLSSGATGTGTGSTGGYTTLQTVKITNPRGYFDVKQAFTRSGSVRIAWTKPGGQSVYSRTQKITVG